MKKISTLILVLSLALSLTACGEPAAEQADAPVELTVFAAASLTEALTEIAADYQNIDPQVTISFNFDSSGTLKKDIQNGAPCDLFIAASQKPMNQLDITADSEKNPDGLDFIDPATRIDLLENKVALAVPEGNPKGITSFDQLAQLLENGDVMLAVGNSDVPVGQYTLKIFEYYGLSEADLVGKNVLTYASNVKEVTTHVKEAVVDCGIIYASDAFSAGLETADTATAQMCGRAIYPAAVLKASAHADKAKAFLDYLSTPEAAAVFESVCFSMAQ